MCQPIRVRRRQRWVAVGSPTAQAEASCLCLAIPRTDYAVAVVDNCFLALWLTMWKTLDECEL